MNRALSKFYIEMKFINDNTNNCKTLVNRLKDNSLADDVVSFTYIVLLVRLPSTDLKFYIIKKECPASNTWCNCEI